MDEDVDNRGTQEVCASTPLPSIQSRARTWGIELELVLAFHRSRLDRVLNQYAPGRRSRLVPDADIGHNEILSRAEGMEGMRHRQLWPTWLLCTRPRDEASKLAENSGINMLSLGWFQYRHSSYETREFTWHRTFALEPLLIAQDILFESRLRPQVIGHAIRNVHGEEVPTIYEHFRGATAGEGQRLFEGLGPAIIAQLKEDTDYSRWTLTRDTSLIAATQDEIQRALNLSDIEKKDWNSDGIELVSPAYSYEDIERGCRKLHRYLDKLEGSGHATVSSLVATIESDSDVDGDNSDLSLTQYRSDGLSHRTWATLKSPFAGSHVHIGVEWKEEEPINLAFLRHLAFLVISNEELISSLHAYKRRGTKCNYSPVDPIFTPTRDDHTAAEKDARKIAEPRPDERSFHWICSRLTKLWYIRMSWCDMHDSVNYHLRVTLPSQRLHCVCSCFINGHKTSAIVLSSVLPAFTRSYTTRSYYVRSVSAFMILSTTTPTNMLDTDEVPHRIASDLSDADPIIEDYMVANDINESARFNLETDTMPGLEHCRLDGATDASSVYDDDEIFLDVGRALSTTPISPDYELVSVDENDDDPIALASIEVLPVEVGHLTLFVTRRQVLMPL
jgi:hypothetical protein